MLYFFNIIALIVSILLIWFKTDAFIEYCKLFNVLKQTTINFNLANNITFPQWLFVTYKNGIKNRLTLFLLKLVTCPICLSFWLSVIFGIMFGYCLFIPILYVFSFTSYLLIIKLIG